MPAMLRERSRSISAWKNCGPTREQRLSRISAISSFSAPWWTPPALRTVERLLGRWAEPGASTEREPGCSHYHGMAAGTFVEYVSGLVRRRRQQSYPGTTEMSGELLSQLPGTPRRAMGTCEAAAGS